MFHTHWHIHTQSLSRSHTHTHTGSSLNLVSEFGQSLRELVLWWERYNYCSTYQLYFC